jgi:hypothetical protein
MGEEDFPKGISSGVILSNAGSHLQNGNQLK